MLLLPKPFQLSPSSVSCFILFTIIFSNINMPGSTAAAHWNSNICSPVSGKDRKEVFYYGVLALCVGVVLIKTGKQWEAPVMTVVSFAQFCLATMIAGIYFFGEKLGSNPFILLRDSGVLDNAPALHVNFDINQPVRPDYMSSIKDGNDLNPLLQNYWMVIHPPVLFLGLLLPLFLLLLLLPVYGQKNSEMD